MTLKLWRALNNPPATHPIFIRTVLLPRAAKRRSITSATLFIGFIMSMSELMPTLLIFLMPVLLGICGLIYGLDCAVESAKLSPSSAKIIHLSYWHCVHQERWQSVGCCVPANFINSSNLADCAKSLVTSTRIAFGIIAILLGLIIIVSFFTVISAPKLVLPVLTPLINVEAVITVLYTEYIQSTIIGCLVGLIISTFGISVLDSFLYAPAIFLLIKITSYAVSLFAGFYLLDMIYHQIGLQGGGMDILLTLLRVTVIVVIQDVIIRLLWRLAIKRTDTMPNDVDLALYPPRLR